MSSLLSISPSIIRDVLVEWLCPQDWTKVDTATSGTLRNDFLRVLSSISNAEAHYQSYEWLCLRSITVKAVSIKVRKNIPETLKTLISNHIPMLCKVNILEFNGCSGAIQFYMQKILAYSHQLSELSIKNSSPMWKMVTPMLMLPGLKQTLKKVDLTGCECNLNQYLFYLNECAILEKVELTLNMPINPLALLYATSIVDASLLARVCSKATMKELYIMDSSITFWYKAKLSTSKTRRRWLFLSSFHSSSILPVIEELKIVELELCKFFLNDTSLPLVPPYYFKTVTALRLYNNCDAPENMSLFLANVAVNVTTLALKYFDEEGLKLLLYPVLTRLKQIKLEGTEVSKEFVKSIIVGGAANLEKIIFQCASISKTDDDNVATTDLNEETEDGDEDKGDNSVMDEVAAKKELEAYAMSVSSSVEIVFTSDSGDSDY